MTHKKFVTKLKFKKYQTQKFVNEFFQKKQNETLIITPNAKNRKLALKLLKQDYKKFYNLFVLNHNTIIAELENSFKTAIQGFTVVANAMATTIKPYTDKLTRRFEGNLALGINNNGINQFQSYNII